MSDDGRRPVGLGPIIDAPEPTTRTPETAASWLGAHVVRRLWLWRREILLALGLVAFGLVTGSSAGVRWGWVYGVAAGAGAAVGAVAAGAGLPGVRRVLGSWLWRGRIRRRWDAACRWAGLATSSARIPRVQSVEPFPAGDRLGVRLPRGASPADLETAADRVAVALDVREVKVIRNPAGARYPLVHVVRRDPFRDRQGAPIGIASPLAWADSWSLWDGVPVGLDDLGENVSLRLLGRNLVVGGEPEAGKSVAMSNIMAAACLDPHADIYGIDAKRVELSLWRPCLHAFVTTSIDDAISLVESLISDMDGRYEKLESDGIRGITRDMGWRVTLLAIDELRFFTAHPDKKSRDKFNALLIDLVARGRAVGIAAMAGTQRPSSDVVPTSLRDIMGLRWAMRCATRDASDTILGAGWATAGHSAATIDVADRGVGLLLAEGALPRRLKSAILPEPDIGRVVARGLGLRRV